MNTTRPLVTALVLAAITFAIYSYRLGEAPVYLHHDEVLWALNAHSLATTGYDTNGRFLPLFIRAIGWIPPLAIYFQALTLKFLPLSEATTRLHSVLIAVAGVTLMYFLCRVIFRRESLAILGAAVLILTPFHFIQGRIGIDHLYPVPFVTAWLLCLALFAERRRNRLIFAATASLGLGVYGYTGSILSMPVLLVLTWVGLFFTFEERARQPYIVSALGFVTSLLPLVVWLIVHPEQIFDQLQMYSVGGSHQSLKGVIADFLTYLSFGARTSAYYASFNPSMLFISGDGAIIDSTREVGIFLLPAAIFIPVGMYDVVGHRSAPIGRIAMMAFLVAPISTLIVPEANPSRSLSMVSFAAVLTTYGFVHMTESARLWARVLAVVLVALMPLQFFGWFYRDYFNDYRVRSAFWFDRNNRGAVKELAERIDRNKSTAYISDDVPWFSYYWQYYLIKSGREDLLGRTRVFDASFDPRGLPSGSVVLTNATDRREQAFVATGGLKKVKAILDEPGTGESFVVFER